MCGTCHGRSIRSILDSNPVGYQPIRSVDNYMRGARTTGYYVRNDRFTVPATSRYGNLVQAPERYNTHAMYMPVPLAYALDGYYWTARANLNYRQGK